jgi:hypothetical protein
MRVPCTDHYIVRERDFGSHCIEYGQVPRTGLDTAKKGKTSTLTENWICVWYSKKHKEKQAIIYWSSGSLAWGIFADIPLFAIYKNEVQSQAARLKTWARLRCCQKAKKYGSCVSFTYSSAIPRLAFSVWQLPYPHLFVQVGDSFRYPTKDIHQLTLAVGSGSNLISHFLAPGFLPLSADTPTRPS